MSLKTALLITGEYRTFDIAVTTWAHLRDIECDVYFATWEGPTREQIEQALTHLPLATIRSIQIKSEQLMADRYPPSKMIYLWRAAMQALKARGTLYDAVILTRPDLMCSGNVLPYLQGLDPLALHGMVDVEHHRINDQLFLGSQAVIDQLTRTRYPENGTEIHAYLAQQLESLPWKDLQALRPQTIVRPNVDPSHELTFEYVRGRASEWWATTHGLPYEG